MEQVTDESVTLKLHRMSCGTQNNRWLSLQGEVTYVTSLISKFPQPPLYIT